MVTAGLSRAGLVQVAENANHYGERQWTEVFERALAAFRSQDVATGRALLLETKSIRGGEDGPSDFYLKLIAKKEKEGLLDGWNGIVEMSEK